MKIEFWLPQFSFGARTVYIKTCWAPRIYMIFKELSPKRHQPSPRGTSDVQQQILVQLQKVNNRLHNMEDEMAEVKHCTGHTKKISSLSLAQKASQVNSKDSDSSSDEFESSEIC